MCNVGCALVGWSGIKIDDGGVKRSVIVRGS